MNVVLIGMPGSGKTTLAKLLAECLNFRFVDIDLEIEKSEKMNINEIFSQKGEKYFREIEAKIIRLFSVQSELVISLGGGAFEDNNTRRFLLDNCQVIYLKTSPNVIYDRIKNDTARPLFKDNMSVDSILMLLNKREKNYKLAHYTVLTDNKSENDIVNEILDILGESYE